MSEDIIEINNQSDIRPVLNAVENPEFQIPEEFYTEAPRLIWDLIGKMLKGEWINDKDGSAITPSGLRRMFGILMAMDQRNRHPAGYKPDDDTDIPEIHVEGDMKIAVQIVNGLSDREREVLSEATAILERIEQEQIEKENEQAD